VLLSSSLRHLIITDCEWDDALDVHDPAKDAEELKHSLSSPYRVALVEAEFKSDQATGNYFGSHLWHWLSLSPTLSTIRQLRISLDSFSDDGLLPLLAFVNRSECLVEEFKLSMKQILSVGIGGKFLPGFSS
jgi:hypothetical protein